MSTPPDNFSTTLSSGIGSSDLSIPLGSVAGLATEGVGVIFTKDANGDAVAGSVEIVHWTGIGGSSLTLTNTGDRGLTGSDAGAQAYSAGAYFEVWVTSYYYDSLLDGIALKVPLTYLDTDGTLAANSDVKVATQKAVKTYVTASASTTGADGWTTVTGTWTYASATTITVPSGAASLYQIGDKIKLTQTTEKYFIVTAVADALLTVTGGSDYSVANAAITSPYYSHQENPIGFPQYFNYTPTGVAASNVTLTGRFKVTGRQCQVKMKCAFTGAITFTTMPTLPITASASIIGNVAGNNNVSGNGHYIDSGTVSVPNGVFPSVAASNTVVTIVRNTNDGANISATSPITWANGDNFSVEFQYEI